MYNIHESIAMLEQICNHKCFIVCVCVWGGKIFLIKCFTYFHNQTIDKLYFHFNMMTFWVVISLESLHWRRDERNGVSNHQPHNCLLNRRSKETPKLRVTGLCEGNSPVTGEFPAQRTSNAENVSIWWRHHDGELGRPASARDADTKCFRFHHTLLLTVRVS